MPHILPQPAHTVLIYLDTPSGQETITCSCTAQQSILRQALLNTFLASLRTLPGVSILGVQVRNLQGVEL